MSQTDVRASVAKQLDVPLPAILALKREPQTPAEQRQRVEYAERALWGASIVMTTLGLAARERPKIMADADELERAWWYLHDAAEAVRQQWSADDRADWDADRHTRRAAIWSQVTRKLIAAGIHVDGAEISAYAAHDQAATDEAPKIRYQLDAKWAREMGMLEVRDPFTGDWHTISSKEAPESWKTIARRNKERDVANRPARKGRPDA
jgi:hypothetical protein